MVKKSIKIYARLKQENPTKSVTYDVVRTDQHETITFRVCNGSGSVVNHKPQTHKFRFQKIFDGHSTQSEVFNTIAKPVVNSVLHGFNGTIFAYGQTGSGKTYAITGSSENYEDRGIIPRSIEEVFEHIKKTPRKYTIYISYMEIYNEIGYDLLNPKQHISCLEELPVMDVAKYRVTGNYFHILPSKSRKVILLEDNKGGSHLRNLSVQKVSTEQEAMKLLFLGDTNRIIAETPMNVYSSRSHCIFTICITSKNAQSGKIRRSKLNLVDLAGSERICKSNITGTTLNEAKYINLSLHYLEQVVLALSQKKSHIPFRNSMLTYMLKDSLSGNCMTVLLATLAVNKKNIDETIATCKFAQRVAEVNLEAVINEEVDPQQEIEFLKREVDSLRKQLLQQSKFKISGKLTKEEKEKWKKVITNYLNDSKDDLHLTNFDMRHIQYCFKLLKEAVKYKEEQKGKLTTTGFHNSEMIETYKRKISEKEEEISTLKSLLYSDTQQTDSTIDVKLTEDSSMELNKENIPPATDSLDLSPAQKVAFDIFMQDPKNRLELDHYINSIQEIYEIARNLTDVIERCQTNIITIRSKLKSNPDRITSEKLDLELINQQSIYRNSLAKLEDLKKETEIFQQGMEQAKLNVLKNFHLWYEKISHDKFENKFGSRTKRNRSYNDINDFENDFRLLWSKGGDSGFRDDMGSSRLRRRSRSTTPSSRECTPIKNYFCNRTNKTRDSENHLYNKNDSFSIPKENYRLRLNNTKNPITDIWKPNSNFSNKLSNFSEEISLNIVDDSINNLLANTNLKSFTPNSCLTSKEEKRRSRSKSPRRKYDCTSSWIDQQKPFNPRVTNRSRSRSPQVLTGIDPFTITSEKKETNQRNKSNKTSNFSVVYNDIMGRNNCSSPDSLEYLTPERPYSSNSSNINYKRDGVFNEKGFTNQYWNYNYEQRPNSSRESPFRILEPNFHFPLKSNKKDVSRISPKSSLNTNDANYRNPMLLKDKDKRLNLETSEVNNHRNEIYSKKSSNCDSLLLSEDSEEFKNFVKTIPLTGDAEVDEEIIKFYRTKFTCKNDT